MATYWVGASGNDGNDGTTHALRKLTMASAITAASSVGDIINVVADDGPLAMSGASPGTITGHIGTSYDSFGLKIRGVNNALEAPAIAELSFTDDASAQTLFDLDTGTPAYIILEGLKVDWTQNATAATNKNFFDRGFISNTNARIQYCHFILSEDVQGRIWADPFVANNQGNRAGEFRYNYIVDSGGSGGSLLSCHQRGQIDVHHNVWYRNGAWSHAQSFINLENNDGGNTDHRVYNNTVVDTASPVAVGTFWISDDSSGPVSPPATKHLHSNVLASVDSVAFTYASGNAAAAGEETNYTRVIGWTLIWLASSTFPAYGYYQIPWDPDGADEGLPEAEDEWSTDVIATADPFNAISTPWAWTNINSSGYSITLAGDWRIKAINSHRSMSQTSGVPGAIMDPIGTPSTPPAWVPDQLPSVPVTPRHPGYFLDPDKAIGDPGSGVQAVLALRRNLDIEAEFRYTVGGVTDQTTKVVAGTIHLATNTASTTVPGLTVAGLTKLMFEPDGDTTLVLDSHSQLIKAGGCLLVANAAGVDAVKINNPSTLKELRVHFFGSL
jgi:hypothetical protein